MAIAKEKEMDHDFRSGMKAGLEETARQTLQVPPTRTEMRMNYSAQPNSLNQTN